MYENFQQTIERAQNYPLYSQDGNGKFSKCISILHIGNIRWYILEGQKEGDDFIMYGIACGMVETEYGYISLNELSQIEVTHQGKQYKVEETYPPFPLTLKTLSCIDDELRDFLDRLYNEDNQN